MTRIRRQDVQRYLNIHPSQMRAWEQQGLISHSDAYGLEECGRLRTLRDLSAKFSSARISASLGAMSTVAGIENPLLDARAVVGGSRVHFRHHGSVTDPISRQFVFDFESPNGEAIEIHPTSREGQVAELFQEAIQYEDALQADQAGKLYERILKIDPAHAPSCINLGTICYNRRRFKKAEKLYRRATRVDPEYALAFFDLGNVLDELKRLPEAITAYRSAIRLVPAYADAHYNVALAYERTTEWRLALRHWSAYLKLDSNSRWASHARMQVRKILDRDSLSIVHRTLREFAPSASRNAELKFEGMALTAE